MKVAVIGGTRGLGNWIAIFLGERGCEVIITGRNTMVGMETAKKIGASYTSSNIEAVKQAEVTILAVPIDIVPQTIEEVSPHLNEGSLLLDVTSVKEEPAKVMEQVVPKGVEFLPTHPMFGPRVRSLDGQVVVLTPLMRGKWYDKVVKILESEKARVIVTTPQIHDRMMSVVQGLTHFAYISIAATLKRLQVDVKESRKFASPVYNLMLDMIARIVAQNPYLYYSIQTRNRYIEEAHEELLSTFQELKDMISNENQEEFVAAMSSAAKHLDDLEAALGRSDKAISALTGEISVLKNSVGEEVGLRHIYSGKVHVGILEDISPDFVTLNRNKKLTRLKISNIEILSSDQLRDFKTDNCVRKSFDVSVVLPRESDPAIIAQTIQNLDDVVDVQVKDVYQGRQIESGKKSITLSYQVINPRAREEVERLLKGFGGAIR